MSKIMGLPADSLTKPVTKDLTLFAKGQWNGYQAAVADVRAAIEDELGIHQRLKQQNPPSWSDRYDDTYYVVGKISKRITKLLEDKS